MIILFEAGFAFTGRKIMPGAASVREGTGVEKGRLVATPCCSVGVAVVWGLCR